MFEICLIALNYTDKNEEDESIKQKVLERSKSYHGQSSSRINDSWALLLNLEKKEQKIIQLNKVTSLKTAFYPI